MAHEKNSTASPSHRNHTERARLKPTARSAPPAKRKLTRATASPSPPSPTNKVLSPPSMCETTATEEEATKPLQGLKPNKATGPATTLTESSTGDALNNDKSVPRPPPKTCPDGKIHARSPRLPTTAGLVVACLFNLVLYNVVKQECFTPLENRVCLTTL